MPGVQDETTSKGGEVKIIRTSFSKLAKYIFSSLDLKTEKFPSNIASWLFYLMAALLGVGTIINWISTFSGIQIGSSLSFQVADGWCDPPLEGIGLHCFGDFAQFVFFSDKVDPFTMKSNVGLSPISAPISTIFSIIGFKIGKQFSLYLYLITSVIAYLAMFYWAVKSYKFKVIPAYLAVLGIATVPFLSVFDRGNNFAYAIPGICLSGILIWRNKTNWALVIIVLLALVKPQYLILLSIIFFSKNWWKALVSLAAYISVFMGLFLIYPNPEIRIQHWFSGLAGYAKYSPLGYDPYFTANISWVNGIHEWVRLLIPRFQIRNEIQFWLEENRGIFTFSICAVLLTLWVITHRLIHKIFSVFALLLIATFASSTTAVYYLGVTSLLVVVFLAYGHEIMAELNKFERIFAWIAIPLIALSSTPTLIPMFGQHITSGRINNFLSLTTPLLWLLWLISLLLVNIFFRGQKTQNLK